MPYIPKSAVGPAWVQEEALPEYVLNGPMPLDLQDVYEPS